MSGHGGPETHDDSTFGKWIGIATAVLGLCVVVSTIVGHKAHTQSLTHKADASDTWGYFQAKKIRGYEAGIKARDYEIRDKQNAEAQAEADNLHKDQKKYEEEAKALKAKAESYEHNSEIEHAKGDWMDLSEGLFELGVILCSLYFLSKKRFFPAMGFTVAAAAALVFVWAFAGPYVMPPHAAPAADAAPHPQTATTGGGPAAH